MDAISIISLTVGITSLVSSVVFYNFAHKAEQSDREILDNIHKAIQEWQGKIMTSVIEMIESQPVIIASRERLQNTKAKHELLYNILERIKYIIEQPFSKDDSIAQTARLNTLLEAVTNIIKSDIPPEVWTKLAEKQDKQQPNPTQDEPDQPKRD